MTAAIVTFNDTKDFCDNLRAEPPDIENVVRVTRQYQRSPSLPIAQLSVTATYLRRPLGGGPGCVLVRLEQHVGSVMTYGGPDQDRDKAEAVATATWIELAGAIKEVGATERGGVYSLPEAQ